MDLPKLDLVILDSPDALELGQFYSGLLGWPIDDGSDQHFATLSPPGGGVTPDNPDGRATLDPLTKRSLNSHVVRLRVPLAALDADFSETQP